MTIEINSYQQIAQRIAPGGRLLHAWQLTGGLSAQVMALEVETADGEQQRWVVRQHGAGDLNANPQVAADEFYLLTRLYDSGLAVPRPLYYDESGAILPTPYIVVGFVDGVTDFAPTNLDDYLRQMAEHLARLHQEPVTDEDRQRLARQSARLERLMRQRPAALDESIDEGRIRDALEPHWPPASSHPPALVHGDFWPGNVLWRAGQVTAIIDWEDAGIGDPLRDVATCRLELLWALGEAAMQRFTKAYQAVHPLDMTTLPLWDLYVALRPAFRMSEWATDAAQEQMMRDRLRWFVEEALAVIKFS